MEKNIELKNCFVNFSRKIMHNVFKLNEATDKATLVHLIMIIQRSNPNGNVEVRFKKLTYL